MSFHPRMMAAIHGFTPLSDSSTFTADGLAVDCWHVRNSAHAGGHYVSLHPRFVIMRDGYRIPLSETRDGDLQHCAACFVPAGMEVWSKIAQPGTLRHMDIHVSQDRLHGLMGRPPETVAPFYLRDLRTISPLVQMLADPDRPEPLREKLADCIILELLNQRSTQREIVSDTHVVGRLQGYVRQNLDRKIGVDDMAADVGLSRSQLNRVMRRTSGLSPYRWVLAQRIEHAKAQLASGQSFAEVALHSGFADQAHFNRVFKSLTGQVPSDWMNEPTQSVSAPILQDRTS